MAWPYNKLAEVAEAVAVEIAETLGAKFYVQGKEYDDDGNLIFSIQQHGEELLAVCPKLVWPAADIDKAFYEGRPECELREKGMGYE